jgi:hypothetical protein
MIKPLSKLGLLVVVLTMLSACANSPFFHQNFMRGQVVSLSGDTAVICIGSHETELQGKSLSVFRVVHDDGEFDGYKGFGREYVGSIVVDSIIDEHFARATVVEGQISKNDMVELAR